MRQVVESVVGIVVVAAFGGVFMYALITPDPMQVEIGRRAHARQECIRARTPDPADFDRAVRGCP